MVIILSCIKGKINITGHIVQKLTLEAPRPSAYTVVTVHSAETIASVIWGWSLIETSWTHRTHLGSNGSSNFRQTATEYFDVPE